MRVKRRALETHIETHGATDPSLRFHLHALGPRKPIVYIIIGINKGNVVLFSKADILLLAQIVLLLRMNVRVVEEDCEINFRSDDRLHDLTGAGRTARV